MSKAQDRHLQNVLDTTSALHGFLLINNREIVEKEIRSSIEIHGVFKTAQKLLDVKDPLTKNLYKMIKAKDKKNEK